MMIHVFFESLLGKIVVVQFFHTAQLFGWSIMLTPLIMNATPQVYPHYAPSWMHTTFLMMTHLLPADVNTTVSEHAFDFIDGFILLVHLGP